MLDHIIGAIAPVIIEAVSAILALMVPVIVGQIAVLLRQKTRVEANKEIQQLRDRVGEVIANGANAAVAAGAAAVTPDSVAEVLNYVIKGAPQAVKALRPDGAVLQSRIEAALAEALRK